jgi:hypothetical protein
MKKSMIGQSGVVNRDDRRRQVTARGDDVEEATESVRRLRDASGESSRRCCSCQSYFNLSVFLRFFAVFP